MDLKPIPEDAEVTARHGGRVSSGGRHVLVAMDHGRDSRRAFTWALTHLVQPSDTLHLLHVSPPHLSPGSSGDGCCVPVHQSEDSAAVLQATEVLFDKLTKEAYDVARVRTERRILEGEPGKVICRESTRIEAAALVMGCRGRGLLVSVLLGSVSEYCTRHALCPVVIVPHKDDRIHELDAE